MEAKAAPDVVMGHCVIRILGERGGRCRVDELRSAVDEAYGKNAVFGNCHGDRFQFDGLLRFLTMAGKLTLDGAYVAVGWVPACSGHDPADESDHAHEHVHEAPERA